MNVIKLALTAVFAVTLSFVCYGQKIQSLKKGELLPSLDVQLQKGDSSFQVNLNQYKGKLLLLDFWAADCTICIDALPKMLALQQKFDNKIQVIVVTRNKREQVQRLWKKFESKPLSATWVNAGRQLPFITGDSILSTLFPHHGVPTHVLINPDQTFLARTYATSTTENNLYKILTGTVPELDEIGYINLNFDDPLSWLNEKTGVSKENGYYSFITEHIDCGIEYIPTNFISDTLSSKTIGINCLNKSVVDLYKEAYSEDMPIRPFIPNNRVIIRSANKIRFSAPAEMSRYLKWTKDNTFCYALKLAPSMSANIFATMKSNLDQFFNLNSRVTSTKVKCWVLKRINKQDKIRSRSRSEQYEKTDTHLMIKNLKMEALFNPLQEITKFLDPELPFLDSTNYHNKIDIKLPWREQIELLSINQLRFSLQHFGLDLVQEDVTIPMLIIEDK